jgi:isopentenyl-diphosphate Delta-isomerase
MTRPVAEEVVLLDEAGRSIGSASKLTVHSTETPLHLAFSCYVFDSAGQLLVTQRALDKVMFPGVWTNTFCGHPAPGEDIDEAVLRRADQELGLRLHTLCLVLPAFRYQATMLNGVRENEMCPVYTALTDSTPDPDPSEVETVAWVPWAAFGAQVLSGVRPVSLWCAQQVAELMEHEVRDGQFVAGSRDDLPPAARHPEVST